METWIALILLLVGCGGARPAPAPASRRDLRATDDGEALDRLVTDCEASCSHRDRLALALRLVDRAAALRASAESDADERKAAEDEARAAAWLDALAEDPALPPALLDDVLAAQLASSDEATQRRVAQRIVRELGPSALLAEGWLWIAERAFLEADLDAAGHAYERVIALPEADAQLRTYARYKLAWVAFDLGDPARACALFAEVAADEGRLSEEARRAFEMALESRALSAEEEHRAIAGIARTPAQRAELEARYERLLELAGHAERAAAFRAAQ